jgi:hypothetical protein
MFSFFRVVTAKHAKKASDTDNGASRPEMRDTLSQAVGTGLPMKGRWSGLGLAALVVLGVGLSQTSQGHVLLRDTGLYQLPTNYTELSFTTPSSLPASLKSERAPIDVSFAIHNVSGSSLTYHWSIVLVRSGRSHLETSGAVDAPTQGYVTVARTVTMTCIGGRLQVVVHLASPVESIDFWMACSARGSHKSE